MDFWFMVFWYFVSISYFLRYSHLYDKNNHLLFYRQARSLFRTTYSMFFTDFVFDVSFFSVTFTITTIILVKVVDNILLQNYSSSSLDINVAYCLFIIFLNLFVRMFIDWKQWHLGKCLFAFLYWCITKISKFN